MWFPIVSFPIHCFSKYIDVVRMQLEIVALKSRSKHGGNRSGAGRKKTGRRAYKVWLTPRAMRALKERAKPKTISEYLGGT